MANNEQRRYERFRTASAVWARPLDGPGDFQLLESVNISACGLLFDLDHPLELDKRLDIRFELPQHPDLIEASGSVVRVEHKGGDNYYIAVDFIEVGNLNISTLMAYLEAVYKD
ncbi:MAG: PilZ domain-containing protein [Acidobacteriota bacterium]|nr:PilZ domain-containing protein [Acidobacteriota bacterium]